MNKFDRTNQGLKYQLSQYEDNSIIEEIKIDTDFMNDKIGRLYEFDDIESKATERINNNSRLSRRGNRVTPAQYDTEFDNKKYTDGYFQTNGLIKRLQSDINNKK